MLIDFDGPAPDSYFCFAINHSDIINANVCENFCLLVIDAEDLYSTLG